MQLVINTRGSYLRKKNNCFLIKNEDKVFEVSVNKIDSILITTSAYISTDAIKFAVENNIDIVFSVFKNMFIKELINMIYEKARIEKCAEKAFTPKSLKKNLLLKSNIH